MFSLHWIVAGSLCFVACFCATSTTLPRFLEKMKNITTSVGYDVEFTCSIRNIRGHKVAWFHVEKKQVIAVDTQVVSSNRRYTLKNSDPSHWVLKIKGVQLKDQGHYMCQINTVPMSTLVGHLKVQVPPDIIDAQTSSDVEAIEASNVTLQCKAFGIPVPKITWRREDSKNIIIHDKNGKRHFVKEYNEEKLNFYGVTREHMGAYLCIAVNGVPPPISRRITLNINFPPVLSIKNQLIGTPVNSKVLLTCIVEAHPKSIIYWTNSSSNIIGNTKTYNTMISRKSYKSEATLVINNVQSEHFGTYRCNAENPYGRADEDIRLYEIQQVSDSRSRLGIKEGQSDGGEFPDWTEQALSVKESYRESGCFMAVCNAKIISFHLTVVLFCSSMITS